jgi:type I restriction enzyme M protein
MGGADSTFAAPMKDARLTIPSPGSLAKVIDMLDEVPIDDLDTKGDVYEYLLSEISTSGKNGQFRTPRHIIQLIVEMIAPEPGDTIVDPASGTCGFLVAGVEYMRSRHADEMAGGAWRSHFTTRCSPISASTAPCCGSGR